MPKSIRDNTPLELKSDRVLRKEVEEGLKSLLDFMKIKIGEEQKLRDYITVRESILNARISLKRRNKGHYNEQNHD